MAIYSYSQCHSASQLEDRLLPQDIAHQQSTVKPQQSTVKPLQSTVRPQHSVGSRTVRIGRESSIKCWLLGVLLLLTIAASWPTGTQASPRRLSGRHLILPHRHHHMHQRSVVEQEPNITYVTPEPTSSLYCKDHRSNMVTRSSLESAKDVAEKTLDAIICLLGQWLDIYWVNENLTVESAIERYSKHSLNLTHPLSGETKKVQHVRLDKDNERFVYTDQAEVGEASEELPKITDALMIVSHMMQNVTAKHSSYNCTFVHIIEKLSHNIYEAKECMDGESCSMSNYSFGSHYPDKAFGVSLEVIKLLTVVQQKYKVLLEKQRDAGAYN